VSAAAAAVDPLVLRAEHITKQFPGTTALADVSFEVYRGAVNALVGENGAGKSTLMKILAGVAQPTEGRILLEGEEVVFESVHDAASKGIGIVFQELNLCPNLSVAENVFLGRFLTRHGVQLDRERQRTRAGELMRRLEHNIDPDTLVGDLPIGEQQIVEIAKALSEDARILIMDEPTSALSVPEVEILMKVIGELKRSGVAIIYISHRLEEVMRIADYVTVLRDARLQAKVPVAEASVPWIIAQMLGSTEPPKRRPRRFKVEGAVFAVRNMTLPRPGGAPLVDDVSLAISPGEIVCIYGLLGAGRSELFECLFGLRAEARGSVLLAGQDISTLPVAARIRAGLFLVPEDRQRDGLVLNLTVGRNLSLATLGRFVHFGSIDRASEGNETRRIIRSLQIKVDSPDREITALSGGNQQKVVVGKSLLTNPKVLLLDEPTRGIDVGAKTEMFRIMRDLSDQGLGVAFATSDLKEATGASDRILVMSRGRITLDIDAAEATDEMLVGASTKLIAVETAPAPLHAES
jgi:erythritol transport system ATP-binding protein